MAQSDQTIQLIFKAISDRARRDVKRLRGDLQDTGTSGQAAGQKVESGFENARKGVDRSRQQLKKYGIELDGQEVSIKDLRKQLQYLENQRDEAFDPDKIINYNRQIRDLQGNIGKMQRMDSSPVPGMGRKLTSLVGTLGLAYGATQLFQRGIQRSIQRGREFESSLAELEAITGITGDRLDRLGDQSLELSKRYGISAANIVEANKLVASQLAQKIDFGTEEGFRTLQQVSEQAVVLATAARTDLASAVETTTSIINQFNLSASESERVINTLAAGAKFGAAEIPAIGRAMVNAGSAASAANVSLEETNAAIQELAANGQVGERAGTALRAIFTRLQTRSEELAEYGIQEVDIKTNGLIATLRQLQPVLNNTTALQKIFGDEAINQAQILIKNADSIAELTGKVTGTGVAYEQAEVNMDTFDGSMQRLQTTIDTVLIPAFTANEGVMKSGLETVTMWVDETGRLITKMNRLNASVGTGSLLLNEYADSWWNVASPAGGFISAIRDAGVWTGLIDSLDSVQDYLDEIDAGTEQIRGHIGDLTATVEHFSEQQKGLKEDSDLYQYYARRIEDTEQKLNNLRRAFTTNLEALREQRSETERGTITYGQLSEEIRQMEIALGLIKTAEEDVTSAIEKANEANEDKEDGVKSLTEKIKENEQAINDLLAKDGELTKANRDRIVALKEENSEWEKKIRLRDQATTPIKLNQSDPLKDQKFDVTAEISAEADQLNDQVTEEERTAHQERMGMIDEQKTAQISAEQDAAIATKKSQEERMKAYGEAAAQAIMYADSVGEGVKMVIQALTAEIITRAILGAFANPSPASLVLAPVLAAGASRLIGSLVPDFERGGFIGGRRHRDGGTLIEAEKDEFITNRDSTRQAPGVLSYINSSPGAAREVQAIFDQIQSGMPVGQDGGVVGTDRVTNIGRMNSGSAPVDTSGMERAVARAIEKSMPKIRLAVDVEEVSNKLTNYNNFQSDIGN